MRGPISVEDYLYHKPSSGQILTDANYGGCFDTSQMVIGDFNGDDGAIRGALR